MCLNLKGQGISGNIQEVRAKNKFYILYQQISRNRLNLWSKSSVWLFPILHRIHCIHQGPAFDSPAAAAVAVAGVVALVGAEVEVVAVAGEVHGIGFGLDADQN